GHKVRMQLQFRGRENAHREIGFEKMQRIKGDMITMAHVDQEPKLVGRNIVMVLSPLPAAQRERKFLLSHGDLIDEDDFEEDDLDGEEGEVLDGEEGEKLEDDEGEDQE
ncbi:MAG: translation initiation factor IF-3, partial [Akkermansiaceae bacterium]